MAAVLGIIDMQRGFFPASEGTRLGLPGFGELGVSDAPEILPLVQALIDTASRDGLPVFYTQDWHPRASAHFADAPNFVTNWPVHCVAETPGAALHPDLAFPPAALRVTKGMEVLTDGADDTSYSAWNGQTPGGVPLARVLKTLSADVVYLAGLASDYCVGHTALDIAQRGGYRVCVVEPATRPVNPVTAGAMRERLVAAGVTFVSVEAATAAWAGAR